MTRYEELVKKGEHCLMAARRCSDYGSVRMARYWRKVAAQLADMALSLTVEQGSAPCK